MATENDLMAEIHALRKAQEHYAMDIHKYEGGHHMGYTPVEHDYASKGVANAGLVTGIIGATGVAANALGNGGLGGLFNGGCKQNYVTEKEFALAQTISAKDAEIGLLKADKYTDQKISEAIVYLDGKISKLAERIECNKAAQDAINLNQATLNTANGSVIACIQHEVARINSAFKFVIPNDSICPGWGNVTLTPATTPAA